MGDLLLGAIGGFAAAEVFGDDSGPSRRSVYLAGVAAGVKMAEEKTAKALKEHQEEQEKQRLLEQGTKATDVIFGAAIAPRMIDDECYRCESTNCITITERPLPFFSLRKCLVCGCCDAWKLEVYQGRIVRMSYANNPENIEPSGPVYEEAVRRRTAAYEAEIKAEYRPSFLSRLFGKGK